MYMPLPPPYVRPANTPDRSTPGGGPPSQDIPVKFKHKRTKTGCLTCRARRIKCDEARPSCLNCSKGPRECKWDATPPPSGKRLKWSNSVSAAEPQPTNAAPESHPSPPPPLSVRHYAPPYDYYYANLPPPSPAVPEPDASSLPVDPAIYAASPLPTATPPYPHLYGVRNPPMMIPPHSSSHPSAHGSPVQPTPSPLTASPLGSSFPAHIMPQAPSQHAGFSPPAVQSLLGDPNLTGDVATLGERAYPTFTAFWEQYKLLSDEVERFNPEQREALARLIVRGPIGEAIRRHVNADTAVPVDTALLASGHGGNLDGATPPAGQAGRDCESPVDHGRNASAASSPGKQLDREAQLAGIRKSTPPREDCEGDGDYAEKQDNSPRNHSSHSTYQRRYT